MKTHKINLADGLAVILLLVSYLAIFFAEEIKVNTDVLTMMVNCYIIAYLAYNISFTDTKKVVLLALPLIIYQALLIFIRKGFAINLSPALLEDFNYIIVNFFDVMFVLFVFFIVELILSRLLGTLITSIIAGISILIYLVMQNTTLLPFDLYYKDLLIYFAFYVLASRINPAKSINKALYPLAIILLGGEIYLSYTRGFFLGIYFSMFVLTYIILKGEGIRESVSFAKYLTLAYLYPYKIILYLLLTYIDSSRLLLTVLAILITYIISQLLYRLKLAVIDYIYVGIH